MSYDSVQTVSLDLNPCGDPGFRWPGGLMSSDPPYLRCLFLHGRPPTRDQRVRGCRRALAFGSLLNLPQLLIFTGSSLTLSLRTTSADLFDQANLSPHLETVWLPLGLHFHKSNHSCADGMIIIWAPSSTPNTSTYGSDISPEAQCDKEYWKPRLTFR